MRLVTVAILLCGTIASHAQTPDCRRFDTVRATLDRTVPVAGLKNSNFALELGPEHKNFKDWDLVAAPSAQRLLLLVEDSSLKDAETQAPVLQVMQDLVEHARPSTQLAISTFGQALDTPVDFSHSRAELKDQVENLRANISALRPGKEISIRDRLMNVAAGFDKPKLGDTIFLITRGPEAGNDASVGKVVGELQQRGIRLFVIYFMWSPLGGVGVVTEAFKPERNDPQSLLKIASDTGGATYPVLPDMASTRYNLNGEKLMKFRRAAGSFYNSMTQFYVIASKEAVPQQEIRIRALTPSAAGGSVTLDYPARLSACLPTD
jgi:hypothetical protein